MSYSQLHYHLVLSTYKRQYTIKESCEKELYNYLSGIIRNHGGVVRAIGGMPDHVHIVLDIPLDCAVGEFIRMVKQYSSLWMKRCGLFPYWEGWGRGYSIFSCSRRTLEAAMNYVNNQKNHHKKASFQEEIQALLRLAGIASE